MSRQFNTLVNEALVVEKELRRLAPDKPSLRCFIAECLSRAGEGYPAVEELKARLTDPAFERSSGTGAYLRNVTREIIGGRFREPPPRERIGNLYWNQKDQAILELGGAEKLFLAWVIAAERASQLSPELFGTVEDLQAHRSRLAELEAKRGELHERIATSWNTSDVVLGKIGSDFAALVSWKMAPDVPVGNRDIAARLIDALLQEHEAGEAEPEARSA